MIGYSRWLVRNTCYGRWVFNGGHKNYLKDQCLVHWQRTCLILHFLTQWNNLNIKVCKPDNFEANSSLMLSLTNICFNFVDCKSFLDQILQIFLFKYGTHLEYLIAVLLWLERILFFICLAYRLICASLFLWKYLMILMFSLSFPSFNVLFIFSLSINILFWVLKFVPLAATMQGLSKYVCIFLRKQSFSQKQFSDIDPIQASARFHPSFPTLCKVFIPLLGKNRSNLLSN